MTKPKTKTTKKQKTTPKKEVVLTKDEFLQTLKKVTRPISPKVSPSKEKSGTSE
jgi:hypothetical protein